MTTPASAEPTDVDYERAADVTTVLYGDGVLGYDGQDLAHEVIARALASQRAEIVARYEKVAEGLDGLYQVHHDNWRANGSTYAEGVSDGLGLASDRIREAAPK